MSRLLLLAGSPPLAALEARSLPPAYQGCYSLDTSTALSTHCLDEADPPTCAATCGEASPYAAILAQFCFCFSSPPDLKARYKDAACAINCDSPYRHESCGGILPGGLDSLYSVYAGCDLSVPYGGDDDEKSSSSTSASSSSAMASTTTAPASLVLSRITRTVYTTITSYTTIYRGQYFEPTVFLPPADPTAFATQPFAAPSDHITVTTSVPAGLVQLETHNPYGSEVEEVEETQGTEVVWAAVVPRTASVGNLGKRMVPTYGEAITPGNGTGKGSAPWPTGSVTGGQGFKASPTRSLLPVTAGAGRAAMSCFYSMVVVTIVGAILGTVSI